jgi:hypothetical protein
LQLLATILARWRRPVASSSSEALDLLHRAMCAVTYQRIAMTIKMAIFAGLFVDCCLFACCPGGHWGNTEQVVARCWRPVASGVALDMPHWAMPSVLLRRTAVAIETAGRRGDSFVIVDFFINNNHSQRPCYGPLKLKLGHSNIYYNVISLLLCFRLPPTTMDAVLATIVAGGQANIN